MSSLFSFVKNHKVVSFLALGGICVAAEMYRGTMDPSMMVPKLMLGFGSLALAKFHYERRKDLNPVFKRNVITGTFLTLGAGAILAYGQQNDIVFEGPIQLLLNTFVAYGALTVAGGIKALLPKSNKQNDRFAPPKESLLNKMKNKFVVPNINKAKDSIGKIREQAESKENNSEFTPLDLTKKNL